MYKRVLSVLLLVLLCSCFAVPLGLAQDETPTVAILRFGNHLGPITNHTESALLNVMQAAGFASDDDIVALEQRQNVMGENANIIWGDAGFDFNNAAQMVENALDAGADVLVTLSTPVTQLAVNATLDMEDPPAIIFAAVFNPKEAGIIQSACIKPAHVTGFEALSPYEEILQIMLTQTPDVEVIGTIFNPAEASGVAGAAAIVAGGESMGLRVEQVSVTGMADLRTATQGLINKGAQLIVLPADLTTLGGLPAILSVANDNSIPIFHAHINAIEVGATLTAGFDLFWYHGLLSGFVLTEYLNGERNIATTAVTDPSLLGVGLNMDSAAELGIEFNAELLEMAGRARTVADGELSMEVGMQGGVFSLLSATANEEQLTQLMMAKEAIESSAPMEEGVVSPPTSQIIVQLLRSPIGAILSGRAPDDAACTAERIAAEQAELDAMEG